MHKQVPSKALRLAWIKRRARRIQRFFVNDQVSLRVAIEHATIDWFRLQGKPLQRDMLQQRKGVRA